MYRRAIMEQEPVAQDQFITKFGSLPVVHSAWDHACDWYQWTKDRNALLRVTCNLAEGSVNTVVSTTKPLVQRYQPQIDKVNSFACEKLALVEENYPIVTRPVDEVMNEGKDRCVTMVKPVTDSVKAKVNYVCDTYNGLKNKGHQTVDAAKNGVVAVRDFGLTQVNKGLDTSVGQFALRRVNGVLTTSDGFVEKFFPAPVNEAHQLEGDAPPQQEIDERTLQGTVTRVQALSTKIRRRMFKRAMRDLHDLQLRSKERIRNFNFTVDLIHYAKSGVTGVKDTMEEKYELAHNKVKENYGLAHNKVKDVWGQINENPYESASDVETFEEISILVARRLVYEIKQDVGTAVEFVRNNGHPRAMLERLQATYTYLGDVCTELRNKFSTKDDEQDGRLRRSGDDFFTENVTAPFVILAERLGFLQYIPQVMVPGMGDGDNLEMEPLRPIDTGRSGTDDDSDDDDDDDEEEEDGEDGDRSD